MLAVIAHISNSSVLDVRQKDPWTSFISQISLYGELQAKEDQPWHASEKLLLAVDDN